MRKRSMALLAAACAVANLACAAGLEPVVYSQKDTTVGTMIPQAYLTSTVPFDRTWAQLSAAQKAVIAADYDSLPAGDEPPFPRYGLAHLVEPANKFFQTWSWSGPFVAGVSIDATGAVKEIKVFDSPNPDMTRVIAALLLNEPFKPATCGGEACARDFVLRLAFPRRDQLPVSRSALARYGDRSLYMNQYTPF